MHFKKLALSTAVAAAVGVSALPTYAAVVGTAGEAGLVPLALNDTANRGTGNTNTYVVLRLPPRLGSDFVLNNYTAPNLRQGLATDQVKVMQPEEWRVHWTWFDPESKNPRNDDCHGSPGDVIIWTTDQDLLDLQGDVDGTVGGVPATFCGDANLPPAGYVVFQTAAGADSLAADFAIEGAAYTTDNNIAEWPVGLLSVPFIPMADGEDPAPSTPETSPRLGLNEVIQPVGSSGNQIGDGALTSPVVVSPLGAGIRMNNGDPTDTLFQVFAGGVQGALQPPAYSMHVMWFDRNNAERSAGSQVLLYDEHEDRQSLQLPIDRELNVILWNSSVFIDRPGAFQNPWDFVDPDPAAGLYTDLTSALIAAGSNGTYGSSVFSQPLNWALSIMGYAEYQVLEEGTELGGENGTTGVNAAAVAFEAHEDMQNQDAWSRHMMTVRGFQ